MNRDNIEDDVLIRLHMKHWGRSIGKGVWRRLLASRCPKAVRYLGHEYCVGKFGLYDFTSGGFVHWKMTHGANMS